VLSFNVNFLADLELKKHTEDTIVDEIGSVILNRVDQLTVYTTYCANAGFIYNHIDNLKAAHSTFAEFLQDCTQKPEMRGLGLNAFLTKPVQRVTKYPLLLRELLKNTPEVHADYIPVSEAIEKIKSIVDNINETTRQVERSKKLEEITISLEKKTSGLYLRST